MSVLAHIRTQNARIKLAKCRYISKFNNGDENKDHEFVFGSHATVQLQSTEIVFHYKYSVIYIILTLGLEYVNVTAILTL